jgi:flagellar biogenesis protein FliO
MWTRGLLLGLIVAGVMAADAAPAAPEPFIPDAVWQPQASPVRGEPAAVGAAAGRMAVTLVLVLVGAGAALWLLRTWLRRVGVAAGGTARRLQLLESLPLGHRRGLALVRIGDRLLVVGHGESGVSHVATLDEAPAAAPTPAPSTAMAAATPSEALPPAPATGSALSRFEQRLRQVLGGPR